MALKYEIDDVSELDEATQQLYVKDEESGKYRLEVEGIDDGAELKKALQKEREDHKSVKARLKAIEDEKREAEEQAEQARREAAKKNGDTEAIEKSYQEKMDKLQKDYEAKLEALQGTVTEMTAGQTATQMASELAVQGSASVLEPHIKSRLKTEYRDGQPVTVVLDKQGQPSAMTTDELKAEIKENPAFAPLIVGTKANGAGGHGDKGDGAKTIKRDKFDAMSQSERSAFIRDGGKVVE